MTITEICRRPDHASDVAPQGVTAESLLEHSPDVTMLVEPGGICRHVTGGCRRVLGLAATELTGTDLRNLAADADRDAVEFLLTRLVSGNGCSAAEFRLRNAEPPLWLEVRGRRLPTDEGAVVTLRDVTARKEGEAVLQEANSLLRHRASIDIVTGLLNRDHFVATLERELRRAQRDRTEVALIALSLVQFREFSERHGWEAADVALRSVAGAVHATLLRPADVAARLEGDEFGVLLPGTDAAGAQLIARRITDAIADLGIAHTGSASGLLEANTGIAVSAAGCEAYSLLRKAHGALRAVQDRAVMA